MAQRLPVPGSDDNAWGDILNGFLGVVHNSDGTLKSGITPGATSSVAGAVQLTGDLGGTSAAPTTPTAVHITGTETIGGIKTFSSSPLAPTPVLTDSSANLATTAFVQNTAYGSAVNFQTLVSNNANYPTWAQVQVQTYTYQSSPYIEHTHSMWFKNINGQWQPLHGVHIGTYTSSGSLSDLKAVGDSILSTVFSNSSKAYVPAGTMLEDHNNGNLMQWNGGTWVPWNSVFINFTPNVTGVQGSYGANPGYTFARQPRYRYAAGRIVYRGAFQLTNGGVNGNPGPSIQIPAACDTDTEISGRFVGTNSLGVIQLDALWNGSTYFTLFYWSPTGTGQYQGVARWGMYSNTPVVWSNGNVFYWDFTYD